MPQPQLVRGRRKSNIRIWKGELIAVKWHKDKPSANIVTLEKLANAYAIGRDIHVGDTIIGIKGRVGFEAAAPLLSSKRTIY
jgi:argininosuccinate synthase